MSMVVDAAVSVPVTAWPAVMFLPAAVAAKPGVKGRLMRRMPAPVPLVVTVIDTENQVVLPMVLRCIVAEAEVIVPDDADTVGDDDVHAPKSELMTGVPPDRV